MGKLRLYGSMAKQLGRSSMQTFDYVMTLLSFVYALAIAHILATAGDIVIAWSRVRFSWLNAAWMLFTLLGILAWWIGVWGGHHRTVWSIVDIAEQFGFIAIIYLEARIVCIKIPAEGPADMQQWHATEARKYTAVYALIAAATVAWNLSVSGSDSYGAVDAVRKTYAVGMLFALSVLSATFSDRRVQATTAAAILATWLWYFTTLQDVLK